MNANTADIEIEALIKQVGLAGAIHQVHQDWRKANEKTRRLERELTVARLRQALSLLWDGATADAERVLSEAITELELKGI